MMWIGVKMGKRTVVFDFDGKLELLLEKIRHFRPWNK